MEVNPGWIYVRGHQVVRVRTLSLRLSRSVLESLARRGVVRGLECDVHILEIATNFPSTYLRLMEVGCGWAHASISGPAFLSAATILCVYVLSGACHLGWLGSWELNHDRRNWLDTGIPDRDREKWTGHVLAPGEKHCTANFSLK